MNTRKEGKKRKWDEIVQGDGENTAESGFNFGFGAEDDDDIP